jgi:hypothetical protein
MRKNCYTFSEIYFSIYYNGSDQSIARQRLGKHVSTHAPRNNKTGVFSMWSAPRNNMSAVFSAWSVPRLYNWSVSAAEMRLVEYRLVQSQD